MFKSEFDSEYESGQHEGPKQLMLQLGSTDAVKSLVCHQLIQVTVIFKCFKSITWQSLLD